MDEYINRKTALENIRKIYELGGFPTGRDAFETINNVIATMSAVDVAPVRHGRWIASHDEFCACSICRYPVYVEWNRTNYCPNCGADMRGVLI